MTANSVKFDPFSSAFRRDPYPLYRELRDRDPVHWSYINVWVLVRYEDIKAVLRDRRFAVVPVPQSLQEKSRYLEKKQRNLNAIVNISRHFLFYLEPPAWTRLHDFVAPAFGMAALEQWRDRIGQIVEELLNRVEDVQSFDLVSVLARPLPVAVISEILGIPRQDGEQLNEWADELARVLEPLLSLSEYEHLNQLVVEFSAYLQELLDRKRSHPEDDLMSALATATRGDDRLSDEEIISLSMLLFATGEETTVNLVGNGTLALLQQEGSLNGLQNRPDGMNAVVEELLRYDSPVQLGARLALKDVEIGGKTIAAGQKLLLCLGGANRDPAVFEDPDRLNFNRFPNRHLAFGDGVHYCLGSGLARLQGRVALETIARKWPGLRLAGEPERRGRMVLRGLKSLPVTAGRSPAML